MPELTKESAAKLKDYYLYQIEKEYSKTFNDKERERLRHFRNIIDGLNENANSSNFSFGTGYYEYIFEYMINRFFGGINISKKYQPKSYRKFKDDTVCEGSSLMPDTIVEYNSDKLLIIDAKYYRFGSLDKKIRDCYLPPTSSVHKQVFMVNKTVKMMKDKKHIISLLCHIIKRKNYLMKIKMT